MIKYLGSKRALAGAIAAAATELGARSAADLFAGTTRVGQALRGAGIEVLSNDTAAYSEAFGLAYVAAGPDVDRVRIQRLLRHLRGLPPVDGYVTETFCRRSRYFQPENGDADRRHPRRDRPARPRPCRARHPAHEPGRSRRPGRLHRRRADGLPEAVGATGCKRARPARAGGRRRAGRAGRPRRRERARRRSWTGSTWPTSTRRTTSTRYLGNYHVWETLVRWDAPDHYGVACKRVDCRTRKSAYNLRRQAWSALADLIERAQAPLARGLVLERGLPPSRRDRGASGPARPRRRGRRVAAALRGRPDRHPRPGRTPGRHRVAPLEYGAPLRVRPRPAPRRPRPRVDFACARSS